MLIKSELILIGKMVIVLFLGAAIIVPVVAFVGMFISSTQIEFDIAVYLSWIVWIIGLNFIEFKW